MTRNRIICSGLCVCEQQMRKVKSKEIEYLNYKRAHERNRNSHPEVKLLASSA